MSRRPLARVDHRFWRSADLPFVESRRATDSAVCYAPHAHATLSLGAVDGGQSVLRRDGRQQRLGRGDVVFIPAGEVHSCNPDDDGRWSYQMLYLDPQWVEELVGETGALDAVVLDHLLPRMSPDRIHARLTALNGYLFGPAACADKAAALVVFVGDLFGAVNDKHGADEVMVFDAKPDARWLVEVKAMIAEHCAEALTLEEMARAAGMSRYHLVRLFRASVGMTPHAWQLDLRIQRARSLLDQGMALADIALQLGFADQSHFQRAFKQRVAATPGEYRQGRHRRNFVQY